MENDILINQEIKSLKEVRTEANGLIVFVEPKQTENLLNELVEVHKHIQVTRENLSESKKVREIIRQPRYDLQNIHKSNKRVLNELKKSDQSLIEKFIGITQPLEDEIDSKIKAVEQEIKDEKEAERRKVEEQRNRIKNAILEWAERLPQIYENCISLRKTTEFTEALRELKKRLDDGVFETEFAKAEEIHVRFTHKLDGLNERIQKAKGQDEMNKQVQVEREKMAKERFENYSILLETIDALGGDKSLFIVDEVNDEQFEIVRNEIKRLKSPEELEKPELDVPEDGAMKPNGEFENAHHIQVPEGGSEKSEHVTEIDGKIVSDKVHTAPFKVDLSDAMTVEEAGEAMRELSVALNKNPDVVSEKMKTDQSEYIEETRTNIMNTVCDLVAKFIYYDRKDDEELTVQRLKDAFETEIVSVDEIVEKFSEQLKNAL